MVDPPKRGVESDKCVDLYEKQIGHVKQGLKKRAKLLEKTFNEMDHISCTEIEGAMYAFPQIHFTEKFRAHAKSLGKNADSMYCMQLLENTGIMVVPGSGFGQKEGTFHFRITNLMTPTSNMEDAMKTLGKFNDQFHERWA